MLAQFHNANHVHRITQIHQHLSLNDKPRSFSVTLDYNGVKIGKEDLMATF
jgi:hypothetical protein